MTNEDKLVFQAMNKNVADILFSSSLYRIPRYQRPYAWEEDHIVDFWNDLNTNPQSYFIGSFVFNFENHKMDNFIDIIDGQQRLLTITILMAVLRDIAKELDDNKLSERIQRHCIAIEDFRGKQTYRILCGDTTKDFFEKYIQSNSVNISDSEPKNKEEKRIKNNYFSLKEKILNELNKYSAKSDKIEFIQDLWSRVQEIQVIWIKIESEENAYEIFETVNARGVELSVSDLLKNLIFKKIDSGKSSGKDIVKEKWLDIEENVRETNTELTKFIRYFWLSKYSFVTEKNYLKK